MGSGRIFAFFLLLWCPLQVSARTLRIATLEMDPFYAQRSDGRYEGYLVDLIDDLVEKANRNGHQEELQHRFSIVSDGQFGKLDTNGQWTGLMGEVINGRADMAVAPMTITKDRMDAVYFSHPFMSAVIVPLVKKPNPGAHMPFTNLTDLHHKQQRRELVVGYVQHGNTELYFSEHKVPIVRAIYNTSKSANVDSPYVDGYGDGVRKVRSSGGKFVLYGEHNAMQKSAQANPCDLTIVWEGQIGVRTYGFIFPRTQTGLDMKEFFNRLLVAAEEDGTTSMLHYRWWDQKATCPKSEMCLCREDGSNH